MWVSANWHTISQGPKKSIQISKGRIDPCPAHTACNKGSFTAMVLWIVQRLLSSTVLKKLICRNTRSQSFLQLFNHFLHPFSKIFLISNFWHNDPIRYIEIFAKCLCNEIRLGPSISICKENFPTYVCISYKKTLMVEFLLLRLPVNIQLYDYKVQLSLNKLTYIIKYV